MCPAEVTQGELVLGSVFTFLSLFLLFNSMLAKTNKESFSDNQGNGGGGGGSSTTVGVWERESTHSNSNSHVGHIYCVWH